MPVGPGAKPALAPVAADAARADVRAVPVVGVCTGDAALLATLRDAAPDLAVAAVDTPQALADLIVARACFAVFLDVRTLRGSIAALVPALARQFPALPIVAVGTRGEEAEVARLIGTGEVYRFLHVPVSLERARTFVGAARRRAEELQQRHAGAVPATTRDDEDDDGGAEDAAGDANAVPPSTRAAAPPATRSPAPSEAGRSAPPPSNLRAMLFALTALGLAVAAGTTWLSRPEPATAPVASLDPIVADLVGAASAAAAAGDLLAPAGRSAADYYRQALARRPDDTEARASLLALADRMLSAGERALVGGRWQEAATASSTVALVRPRDPRVLALRTRAEAARAAAEAIPATAADDAPPVPATGNTDERAGYEDARDTSAVPASPRASGDSPGDGDPAGGGAATATPATVAAAPAASLDPVTKPPPVFASSRRTSAEDASLSTRADGTASAGTGPALPEATTGRDAGSTAASATANSAAGTPASAAPTAPVSTGASTPEARTETSSSSSTSVAATRTDASAATPAGSSAASSPPALPPRAAPRPVPLRKIEDAPVVYPARARSRGIEGWVDVAFTVDTAGRVTGARVLSAQPAGTFDDAALDAVRRWRYAPPPAARDANVRLRFRLDR